MAPAPWSGPFADDPGFVVSPCAYVVGLLDDLVISELELERRGLRYWMADPNLWVPFDDGTAFGQWLDDSRTQANLEELGVSARDIEGYWAYEELFDDVRRRLRQGRARHLGRRCPDPGRDRGARWAATGR